MGRLFNEPETRYDQNNLAITKFGIAVDGEYAKQGEKPESDFINCVAFGKTGEFVQKYFRKGNKIALNGRWKTGSYTNKDGRKVYTNDCIVTKVEFAESKNPNSNSENQQAEPVQQQKPNHNSSYPSTTGFMEIPDSEMEELPFQ